MPSNNLFSSFQIKRQHIHEQVADHIEEMIADKQLQEGEQLPSERELAGMFGVNRGSIRQAISLLQHRGLVQSRLGSGTYITRVPGNVLGQSIERYVALGNCTHEDLLDLREIHEPGIAALAARRATSEDLARLKALVEQIETANNPDDLMLNIAADADFHKALATATHNPLITAIMTGLQGAMRTWLQVQAEKDRGQLLDAVRGHRVIYNAIADRDPERARDTMRQHIAYARRLLSS
jgi:DNA-binding FadR family transcriptional regulator